MSNFDLLDLAATLAGIALFGWLGAIISSRSTFGGCTSLREDGLSSKGSRSTVGGRWP